MDADEREIFDYLQTFGEEWVNAKEICRRAGGKRRYAEDPNWARPILQRMRDRNLLEKDMAGRFRIRNTEKKGHKAQWISPDIEAILREGGVQTDAANGDLAAEETSEPL